MQLGSDHIQAHLRDPSHQLSANERWHLWARDLPEFTHALKPCGLTDQTPCSLGATVLGERLVDLKKQHVQTHCDLLIGTKKHVPQITTTLLLYLLLSVTSLYLYYLVIIKKERKLSVYRRIRLCENALWSLIDIWTCILCWPSRQPQSSALQQSNNNNYGTRANDDEQPAYGSEPLYTNKDKSGEATHPLGWQRGRMTTLFTQGLGTLSSDTWTSWQGISEIAADAAAANTSSKNLCAD